MGCEPATCSAGSPSTGAAVRWEGWSDLLAEDGPGGPRITAAVVVQGPWGRLLGYERDEATGPWLLEAFARVVLRRNMTTVPWSTLRLSD